MLISIAVRGTISFKIEDYWVFINKLHRLSSFNLDDVQQQICDAVSRNTKNVVANALAVHNIPLVRIETKTAQIKDVFEVDLGKRLKDTFGVVISEIDIVVIEIDKSMKVIGGLWKLQKMYLFCKISD